MVRKNNEIHSQVNIMQLMYIHVCYSLNLVVFFSLSVVYAQRVTTQNRGRLFMLTTCKLIKRVELRMSIVLAKNSLTSF